MQVKRSSCLHELIIQSTQNYTNQIDKTQHLTQHFWSFTPENSFNEVTIKIFEKTRTIRDVIDSVIHF